MKVKYLQVETSVVALKHSEEKLGETESKRSALADSLTEVIDQAAFDAQRCRILEAEVLFPLQRSFLPATLYLCPVSQPLSTIPRIRVLSH